MPVSRSNRIVISTTSTLQGWSISEYLDVVSARAVAGTNIFSDIAASFSDVFGGRSKSYQKQLARINEQVLQDLQKRASRARADALIGVKIDHDEISGGNRQLLMVTATGTAVRASKKVQESSAGESDPAAAHSDVGRVIGADELHAEMRKVDLLHKVKEGNLDYTDEVWRFLTEHAVEEMARDIRETVDSCLQRRALTEPQKKYIRRSREYFHALPEEDAKAHLYNLAAAGSRRGAEYATEIIKERKLLDWQWITTLLDSDTFQHRKRALPIIMEAHKPVHVRDDIGNVQQIVGRLHNSFPKQGEIIEVDQKGVLSSGTEEKWVIDGGAPIDMDKTYDPATKKDIHGFKRHEVRPEQAIDKLKKMYDVLASQVDSSPSTD